MTKTAQLVVSVGLAMGIALLTVSSADASNQGITGKKLLLKSTPKIVLLSKDGAISIAGSDPVNGADSSISFDVGGGPVTFALPKNLWSANGSGTLFKYKNAAAPSGPSVVKIAKVKAGLLKVVAKGVPFAVPNGAATINIVLSLDGGTNTYCLRFSGTGDGNTFLVKDAPAGACAVCGNNIKEGTEVCDGADATACPGNCLADCTCAVCGNNLQEGTEECDGTFDTACPGNCLANCTCQVCGNNVQEGTEQCDGISDLACPGNCLLNCTCAVCGNNIREGTEICDGGDATACPSDCLPNCTCATPCPASGGDPTACNAASNPGACQSCCGFDLTCTSACLTAFTDGCAISPENDACAAAANAQAVRRSAVTEVRRFGAVRSHRRLAALQTRRRRDDGKPMPGRRWAYGSAHATRRCEPGGRDDQQEQHF